MRIRKGFSILYTKSQCCFLCDEINLKDSVLEEIKGNVKECDNTISEQLSDLYKNISEFMEVLGEYIENSRCEKLPLGFNKLTNSTIFTTKFNDNKKLVSNMPKFVHEINTFNSNMSKNDKIKKLKIHLQSITKCSICNYKYHIKNCFKLGCGHYADKHCFEK